MLDNIREQLAWRRARRLIERRPRRPWASDASKRRVLVVMPPQERMARPAWEFVERLNLDPDRVLPIVPTGEIAFSPMAYLGKVRALDPEDVSRLGLPRKRFLREVWAFDPDVALCLTMPFDLSLAIIAAASPAAFRAGFANDRAENFFDLIVSDRGEIDGALNTLDQALSQIRPTVLETAARPTSASGRPAW